MIQSEEKRKKIEEKWEREKAFESLGFAETLRSVHF